MKSLQTDEQYRASQRRIFQIQSQVSEIRQITSCEWTKQKQSLLYKKFVAEKRLSLHPETEAEILNEIVEGTFFGIAKGYTFR